MVFRKSSRIGGPLSQGAESLTSLANRIKTALENGDPASFGDLLDANVRWGPPGDPSPPCQNKDQVLAWYLRARQSGARARVSEVSVVGDRILVGMVVAGTDSARQSGGQAARWQLLSLRNGRVVDIVGFEQRVEAVAWAARPTS
ncbi:MAG: nuclear transport factor 2 family protein [Acidimicrobiales bacterium]